MIEVVDITLLTSFDYKTTELASEIRLWSTRKCGGIAVAV